MSCFFGHKWDGCKCTKCGTTRDEAHHFVPVPGECLMRCERCGKEKEHQWENAGKGVLVCSNCGKGEVQPDRLFDWKERLGISLALSAVAQATDKVEDKDAELFAKNMFVANNPVNANIFVELINIIEALGKEFPPMLANTGLFQGEEDAQVCSSIIAKGRWLKKRLGLDTETEKQEAK